MTNNFEEKHPRAKDGKFTEKRRKEAGMSLDNSAFSTPDWPKKHVDELGYTTLYWEDKPFVDLTSGERYLVEEQELLAGYSTKTFKTSKGYEQDTYRGGALLMRTYLDRDKQTVRKFNQPYQVSWRSDGMTEERFAVEREDAIAHLSVPGTKFNTRVLRSRVLREDGTVAYEQHFRKAPDISGNGEVIGEEFNYYEDGAIKDVRRFRIDGKPWDESVVPSRQEYSTPLRPGWYSERSASPPNRS